MSKTELTPHDLHLENLRLQRDVAAALSTAREALRVAKRSESCACRLADAVHVPRADLYPADQPRIRVRPVLSGAPETMPEGLERALGTAAELNLDCGDDFVLTTDAVSNATAAHTNWGTNAGYLFRTTGRHAAAYTPSAWLLVVDKSCRGTVSEEDVAWLFDGLRAAGDDVVAVLRTTHDGDVAIHAIGATAPRSWAEAVQGSKLSRRWKEHWPVPKVDALPDAPLTAVVPSAPGASPNLPTAEAQRAASASPTGSGFSPHGDVTAKSIGVSSLAFRSAPKADAGIAPPAVPALPNPPVGTGFNLPMQPSGQAASQ